MPFEEDGLTQGRPPQGTFWSSWPSLQHPNDEDRDTRDGNDQNKETEWIPG
jgi:hypothetical protein